MRGSSLRFKFAFLFFVVAALGLVSCTKKPKDEENSLNISVEANLKGFDPVLTSDVYANLVVSQIYEPLLHYHYFKRPLELQPLLAAEMPSVSKDGLTHTIKIRSGIKFHDSDVFPDGKGREVTAEDFVYSWKRLADPKNQSDGFWVFDNKIKGLNEWRDKVSKGEADYGSPVEGLQAPDKTTIVIKLTRPYYQLHYVLAMSYTAVVPKEAVDKYGKEFINHPVGTGPFKFESWTRNNKVVLSKNPNWNLHTYPGEGEATDESSGLLKDKGQKIPFVDKVVIHEMIEEQPRWLNFLKGTTDFEKIPKDNFDNSVKNNALTPELAQKGMKLWINQEPDVTYTSFNMLDPVLGKNEHLRRAIAHAIDTETMIQKFYNGRAISAQSPIPPTVDAYDPAFKAEFKEYNVAKAKEFLAKAGYPEGKGLPSLEYSATNSSTARQMAEFMKDNLAKVGINLNIVTTSWPQFTEKLRQKKAQIFGIAWLADYPDAENFLQLLYGPNASPGPNNSNYKNKEFDELYDKAGRLPPGPERTALYQKMRDIVARDLPWVPNVHRLGYTVHHGWLGNFKYHRLVHDFPKYMKVDTKARAETKAKL